MLRQLWPSQAEKTAWIALIFLLYPGFRQQYISINSSRHILPLALAFLSFGFMLAAWRASPGEKKTGSILRTLAALVLMALSMLSTEYYYGMELVRPAVLFLAVGSQASLPQRLKTTFRRWLPYLVLLVSVFAWRYIVSPRGNYPIVMTDQLSTQPLETFVDLFQRIGQAFLSTSVLAWGNLFDRALLADLGIRIPILYAVLVLLSGLGCFIYFLKAPRDPERPRFWAEALALGALATLCAVLPFLVTGLAVDLKFAADRTTLSMMFGVSLMVIGFIDLVGRHRQIKIGAVSVLAALAIGMHFLTAVSYWKDWQQQKAFFHQLITRAPSIAEGSLLFFEHSTALQNFRSTDNSLTGPVNWVYEFKFRGRKSGGFWTARFIHPVLPGRPAPARRIPASKHRDLVQPGRNSTFLCPMLNTGSRARWNGYWPFTTPRLAACWSSTAPTKVCTPTCRATWRATCATRTWGSSIPRQVLQNGSPRFSASHPKQTGAPISSRPT